MSPSSELLFCDICLQHESQICLLHPSNLRIPSSRKQNQHLMTTASSQNEHEHKWSTVQHPDLLGNAAKTTCQTMMMTGKISSLGFSFQTPSLESWSGRAGGAFQENSVSWKLQIPLSWRNKSDRLSSCRVADMYFFTVHVLWIFFLPNIQIPRCRSQPTAHVVNDFPTVQFFSGLQL